MKAHNTLVLNILLLASLLFIGCGTTGKNFNESLHKNIVVGTTTHKEIQAMFGSPFKKGIQNGYKTWTYEYNFYNALGNNITKDIIIVFTQSGVVKSHQMMTNQN
jgi:hypothetical protein